MVQDDAEDAGLLAQVKDDNEVMHQPPRRTCLDICLDCYKLSGRFPTCDNSLCRGARFINRQSRPLCRIFRHTDGFA